MRLLVPVAFAVALFSGFSPVMADATENASPGIRAAFYYAWYPEQWDAAGHRASSVLGRYDSSDPELIARHVRTMAHAGIEAAIYSWWGQQSPTDRRFPAHLDTDPEFRWAIYYELDHDGRRPASAVEDDLAYLQESYFDHPAYLHVDGRPVVFVYAPFSSCERNEEWAGVSRGGVYVSMTDFPEWWTCNSIDSWHGYAPAQRVKAVWERSHVYSLSVSAGFWAAGEREPRLKRDFSAWERAVAAVQRYTPDWELYYFNEFGEGTQIEPSDARCVEWICTDYIQTLAENR